MRFPNHAVVLLAAGSSSRMGAPKQLLAYQGKPLIRYAVETAVASGCGHVIVVLGANAEPIRAALDGLPVSVVENPDWAGGMGTSIRSGITRAEELGLDGAILALADQPLITAAILARLIEEHLQTGQPIVSSQYAGTVGVPVFFAKSHFGQLLALAPDQGCKGVILRNGDQALRIDCPEAEADIDTPDDYGRLAV